MAGDTPLRSIEVGTEDMGTAVGACDGFACTFFNTLSWRDDESPLPVGINPRVTFERMFGETDSTEQRFARLKEKQSLLDSVTEETAKLKRSLGAPDRAILDEYLGNIRDVEKQLDRMESRLGTITGNPEAPIGLPDAFDDHMTITYNLMHLAYQGDISRVFTFMTGHEASDRGYGHIGIPEQHHTISHHGNDPEKLAKYAKIATYQIEKFAEFLDKLKATKEGDGNLLDHSVLYWGSGMSNGNAHDRNNPPAVIVGGANGRLKGNRHIVAKDTSRPRTCCSRWRTSAARRSISSARARDGWICRLCSAGFRPAVDLEVRRRKLEVRSRGPPRETAAAFFLRGRPDVAENKTKPTNVSPAAFISKLRTSSSVRMPGSWSR